jgi:pimeloyl-ACP methyl ester carboxylesterase
MESGLVEVDGNQIHYYLYGYDGPRIVLLHGFGHNTHSLNFTGFLESMSDSYRLLAFDLLGHGRSSDPSKPLGLEDHARLLHSAAVKLGYHKYNLIGYSFGGVISIRIAALFPENVERLVVVDITPSTYESPRQVKLESNIPLMFQDTESAVKWLHERMPYASESYLKDNIDKILFQGEGDSWIVSSHPSRKRYLLNDGDGWRFLSELMVPSLLVRGSESHLAVCEEVQKMIEVLEGLKVVTINGAGHMLPFSHKEQFEKTVRDFILS